MLNELYLYLGLSEVSCFDNEGGDGGSTGGDGGDGGGTGGTGDDGGGTGGDGGGDGDTKGDKAAKTFTQDDLNRVVEERLLREKKKGEEKYRDLEGRYTALLDNQNLSTEERAKLEENLEDVQKQLRSKDEDAKHHLNKVQEAHAAELAKAKKAAESWEEKFFKTSIDRSLLDAASTNDAYNSSQVVSLLRPMTKLRAVVDEVTGQETGDYETVIDFKDRDDKGLEVITQRSPTETVKRMKELSDYANLFKSNVVSGVGANSATGGIAPGAKGQIDVNSLTAEQYAKIRKENPALLGL